MCVGGGDPKALSSSGLSGCSALPPPAGARLPISPASAHLGHATLFGSPGGGPQAAYAHGRRAGPAFRGARAELRPGPSPRRAAGPGHQRPEPSPEGPRAEGRLCPSRAAASPARTSTTMSPPRPNSEQQQVFLGKLERATGVGAWAARLGGRGRTAHSPSAGGRAAAGARSSWPQDAAATTAPWGLSAKLPPTLPPRSPRTASAAPQPPREHVPGSERAPSARAGRAAGA